MNDGTTSIDALRYPLGNSSVNQTLLDQNTINQITNEIIQANNDGATTLSSRDIPNNTHHLTQDPNTIPTYIPPAKNKNYIPQEENINYVQQKQESNDSYLETLYNHFQIPILLTILFFLFQLPIVKRTLFSNFPFLFHNDGNMNTIGLIMLSISFGCAYFVLVWIIFKR